MIRKDASVLLVYKNFAANRNISHIGLGVAALNNQKNLRAVGIKADVRPIVSAAELRAALDKEARTHVIVSAPWMPSADLASIGASFTETQFFVVSHSNVGFLQADTNGMRIIRETMELEAGTHNIHIAGNSQKFAQWLRAAYGAPCAYLPNSYYLDGHTHAAPPSWTPGTTLRIGVFGATRPLKNLMSAAGAALEISRDLRSPLELWLSAGRAEGGGHTVLSAVQEMLKGIPSVELKFNGWQPWPGFRKLVGSMHLLLQPSYTESFNMVTADGVAEGVPSVVSSAIEWAPDYWKADVDNVLDIARAGKLLLNHRAAARDGLRALAEHNRSSLRSWGNALWLSDIPEYSPTVHL